MIDIERDIKLAKSGKEDLIYKTLVGLKADLSKPIDTPEILAKDSKAKDGSDEDDSTDGTDNSEQDESSEEECLEENESKFVTSARPRNESPESRKVM